MWRKYKIETKGVTVVIEELKQRICAKAHKIKRYNDRILQYQQNRLFEVNQRQFTKNLMTHREVTNRLLMLMKPESFGVIFGTGQWNTEEMLVG